MARKAYAAAATSIGECTVMPPVTANPLRNKRPEADHHEKPIRCDLAGAGKDGAWHEARDCDQPSSATDGKSIAFVLVLQYLCCCPLFSFLSAGVLPPRPSYLLPICVIEFSCLETPGHPVFLPARLLSDADCPASISQGRGQFSQAALLVNPIQSFAFALRIFENRQFLLRHENQSSLTGTSSSTTL